MTWPKSSGTSHREGSSALLRLVLSGTCLLSQQCVASSAVALFAATHMGKDVLPCLNVSI